MFVLFLLVRIDLQRQMYVYRQVSFDWWVFTLCDFVPYRNCLTNRGVRVILYVMFIIYTYDAGVYKVSRCLSMSCSKFSTSGAEDLSDIFDRGSQNATQPYLKFIWRHRFKNKIFALCTFQNFRTYYTINLLDREKSLIWSHLNLTHLYREEKLIFKCTPVNLIPNRDVCTLLNCVFSLACPFNQRSRPLPLLTVNSHSR